MAAPGPHQLWQAALGELQLQVARPSYQTFLQGTVALGLQEGSLVVGTASSFVAEYLEKRLYATIQRDGGQAGRGALAGPIPGPRTPRGPPRRSRHPPRPRAYGGRRPPPPGGNRPGLPAPPIHLRHLHRGALQRPLPRGRHSGRATSRCQVQPPLHLLRCRVREDPPPPGYRSRSTCPGQGGGLPDLRAVHQRLHPGYPGGADARPPRPLSRRRRPAHRRHPVPLRKGADPGGGFSTSSTSCIRRDARW